jgi:hypothetical protein
MGFLTIALANEPFVSGLSGQGTLIVNGTPYGNFFTGEFAGGASITITAVPFEGYVFQRWNGLDGATLSTSNPYTFTMPSGDVYLNIIGALLFNPGGVIEDPNPADTYGLKYFFEYKTVNDQTTRIEIEEDGFAGSAVERNIENVEWTFGNLNQSPFQTIIRQSLSLNLSIESGTEYQELFDADNRKFRVTYKRNNVIRFIGYVVTDFIERPEIAPPYLIKLSCTDGLNALDFEGLALGQFADKEKLSMYLVRALNQSFQNKRKLVSSIRIFEDDMATGNDKDPLFQAEAVKLGFITEQQGELLPLNLKEAVERVAKPFISRVFAWGDKWYIVSLFEYDKASIRYVQMTTDGVYESNSLVTNDQNITLINRANRIGRLAFTEFSASLDLEDLTVPDGNLLPFGDLETGAWTDSSFGFGGLLGYIPWLLTGWQYINAVPFDSIANVQNTTSRIERVSIPYQNTFARIWGTATSFSDSNLSSIRITPQVTAVEEDNILTFQLRFSIHKRLESAPNVPIDHFLGFKLSVSDGVDTKYLATTDGIEFTWEDTDTIVSFRMFNTGVFNNLRIDRLIIPITGQITLQVYQLVNTGVQDQHLYALDVDDLALMLEKNSEFTFQKVLVKATTVTKHPNIFDEFETNLGDALSANNTAAMLVGDEVTENWAREGVTENQPLLALITQGLANIKGKPNYTLQGEIDQQNISPLKCVNYDGQRWVLNSFTHDDYLDRYNIELVSL